MAYTIDDIMRDAHKRTTRDATMRLRIEPLLKDICTDAAKAEGLALSAWVRRLLIRELTDLGYIENPRPGQDSR